MKNTEYYKSRKHVENVKKAAILGAEVGKVKRLKRIEEYSKNPKLCKHCNSPIDYDKKRNLYCSSSCSATVTNLTREPRSVESRKKTSLANTGKKHPDRKPTKNYTNIFLIKCKICGKEQFVGYRKKANTTCGYKDCVIQACVGERNYQNGTRKPVWYFNKNENKEVLLESSWEVMVATHLDSLDIKWVRPKFIKWVDNSGKTRRYFPDFYLPNYDVYLDPKNPYCMKTDEEKMKIISTMVSVIYGNVNDVINWINSNKE